jgi:YggT family protein
MLGNAIGFLLETVFGLFTIAVLLRFYLQLTNAPFKNPVSQAIVAVTNFAVIPARRIIPSWGKIDLSTLVLAFITQCLLNLCLKLIDGFPIFVAGTGIYFYIALMAMLQLAKLSIYLFLYAVVAQAILSWVNPYTPISGVLEALTRPVMTPIRKYTPLVGGIDLSPIVLFILANLLIMLLIQPLERQILTFI